MCDKMSFNTEFYSEETIRVAIKDYMGIADISVRILTPYHVECFFSKCAIDSKIIMREFGNYLLALNSRETM